VGILINLLHRFCLTITSQDLIEIFDYNFPDTVKPEIQECVFQRAELIKQIQEIQGQLPDESGQNQTAGLNAPPPVAPLGQGRPLQAQAAPNQNTMRGMPGARLPNATVIQTTPDENSGGTTDIYGQIGGPTQQMGVQQTQADAQIEDAQIAAGQQQGLPPQPLGAGQGQGDIQAQHDDLQQQLQDLDKRYEDLMTQVTWDKIIEFFRKDNLVSFLVTARLDDLENKIIADEKKNSDLEYMNSIMNLVNQIIANVNSNPKFTDIYSSIFSLSLDNFDQTKAQRDSIDEFIREIKEVGKQMADNPPQQPPPSPDDQEKLAKAQLLQAQAREIEMKIQMQQMQMQQGAYPDDKGNRIEEMQLQHQNDMQLQQAKITAEHEKYANKMKSDEQLLQMKIQADKERYEEKMKSDIVDKTNQPQF
jgi:hypothetical protein